MFACRKKCYFSCLFKDPAGTVTLAFVCFVFCFPFLPFPAAIFQTVSSICAKVAENGGHARGESRKWNSALTGRRLRMCDVFVTFVIDTAANMNGRSVIFSNKFRTRLNFCAIASLHESTLPFFFFFFLFFFRIRISRRRHVLCTFFCIRITEFQLDVLGVCVKASRVLVDSCYVTYIYIFFFYSALCFCSLPMKQTQILYKTQ